MAIFTGCLQRPWLRNMDKMEVGVNVRSDRHPAKVNASFHFKSLIDTVSSSFLRY